MGAMIAAKRPNGSDVGLLKNPHQAMVLPDRTRESDEQAGALLYVTTCGLQGTAPAGFTGSLPLTHNIWSHAPLE